MIAKRVAARYLEARWFKGKIITKLWVVIDPTVQSTLADVWYETTPREIVNLAVGTGTALWQQENTTFHDSASSALADAKRRLALRDAAQAKKGLYPVERNGNIIWVTVPKRD